MHRVGRTAERHGLADHNLAEGRGSPVVDAPRIAGSGHDIPAVGVRAAHRESGRDSDRSLGGPVGTDFGEERRSRAVGLDHRGRAKVERKGSGRWSVAEGMG